MNTPTRSPIGSTEELREYAADCLRLAALYASHGRDLAEAGDDLGLISNTHKLLAAVKAAALTIRDLRARTCMD